MLGDENMLDENILENDTEKIEKPYQYSAKSPLIVDQCVTCGTLRLLLMEPAECPTCTKYGKSTTETQKTIMLPVSHDIAPEIKIAIAGRFLA